MRDAPELNIPEDLKAAGEFSVACPPDVQALYTKIWTDVLK